MRSFSFGCQKSVFRKDVIYWGKKNYTFFPSCAKLMPTDKIAKAFVNVRNADKIQLSGV